MFSRLSKRLLALLFAPLFAVCLVTSSGCEGEDVDGVGEGIEVEDEGLGEGEIED